MQQHRTVNGYFANAVAEFGVLVFRLALGPAPHGVESHEHHHHDVADHDALVRALDLPLAGSAWFDVPGPEVLSGRAILERTAAVLGVLDLVAVNGAHNVTNGEPGGGGRAASGHPVDNDSAWTR